MGKGVETGILGGLGALSGYADIEAGKSQQLAIKRQIIQEKMRRNSEQITSDERMEQLNATQIARATTSGFDYSGSFANLTASNIDKYGQDSHIKDLSSKASIDSAKIQYHTVMKQAWANVFGQAVSTAGEIAELGWNK